MSRSPRSASTTRTYASDGCTSITGVRQVRIVEAARPARIRRRARVNRSGVASCQCLDRVARANVCVVAGMVGIISSKHRCGAHCDEGPQASKGNHPGLRSVIRSPPALLQLQDVHHLLAVGSLHVAWLLAGTAWAEPPGLDRHGMTRGRRGAPLVAVEDDVIG